LFVLGMQTTNYDSSSNTKRDRDKVISDSFTRQKPLQGITEQSIMNSVLNGRIAYYRKNLGDSITVDTGCPCSIESAPVFEPPPPIPESGWATGIGGGLSEIIYGVATDLDGNVYVSGYFGGGIQINNFISGGGGAAITVEPYGILSAGGGFDGFLVKYDKNGKALWATNISGTNTEYGIDIATDSSGNLYVCGIFNSSKLVVNSFKSKVGLTITVEEKGTLNRVGTYDSFIVKYNTDGVAQWATSITGGSNGFLYSLAADTNGNVYVMGNFTETTISVNRFSSLEGGVFDIQPYGTLTKSGAASMYIAKYNTNGSVMWATKIGQSLSSNAGGISVDSSGNVYITKTYEGNSCSIFSFQSGGGGGPITLTSFGSLTNIVNKSVIFTAKFNSFGVAQWATQIDATTNAFGTGVSADSEGNVYAIGRYNGVPITINSFLSVSGGTVILDPVGTLTNSGSFDSVIVKYNKNGVVVWATTIGGSGIDAPNGVANDPYGNVYIGGYYTSSLLTINNFDRLIGGVFSLKVFGKLTGTGAYDAYLIKFNSEGKAQWAVNLPDTGNDQFCKIATDSAGNVFSVGQYGPSQLLVNTFNQVNGEQIITNLYGSLASVFNYDGYIVKYTTNGQI
jgi:hypothetical protein